MVGSLGPSGGGVGGLGGLGGLGGGRWGSGIRGGTRQHTHGRQANADSAPAPRTCSLGHASAQAGRLEQLIPEAARLTRHWELPVAGRRLREARREVVQPEEVRRLHQQLPLLAREARQAAARAGAHHGRVVALGTGAGGGGGGGRGAG
jgi:hypothetical protein